jgi:hypothetical protein
MEETLTEPSWSALLVPRFMLPLAVLLGQGGDRQLG